MKAVKIKINSKKLSAKINKKKLKWATNFLKKNIKKNSFFNYENL